MSATEQIMATTGEMIHLGAALLGTHVTLTATGRGGSTPYQTALMGPDAAELLGLELVIAAHQARAKAGAG